MEIIRNKKTLLRHFEEKDAEAYILYRSDRDWLKFQNASVPAKESALKFFGEMRSREFGKRGEWVQFAIEEIEGGKLIGDIGLKPELYDYRVVEIGISVAKNYSGKGLAKDAVGAAMKFLFREKNMHRLIGIANVENKSSIELLKKLGFRKEAHFKKSYCINEKWYDEYLFALLKEEWIDF